MLKSVSRLQLVAAWIGIVVMLFAVSVLEGVETSAGNAALWLLVCLAPPSVMLLVWRTPTPTVAEVLFDATHPNTDGRR